MKLNVGCGFDVKPGYINIDAFDTRADRIMPADKLDFSNESVDEVYSSQMLEHASRHDTLKILNEWYRVLKDGGKLELEIPDLEWLCRNWLSKPESERWGFWLDTIFGLETNEGEFHKTGFTKERIRSLLTMIGFNVEKVEPVWSHAQWCISVSATKIKEGSDEVWILDCFPNNKQRTVLLKEQINKVKSFGIPIILSSHTIVPEDICASVDYVVYDKRNIKSTGWDLQFFYTKPRAVKVIYKNPSESGYHGVGCYSGLKNGVDLAASRFKFGHFLEYDVNMNIGKYLKMVRTVRREGKKFIGFQYPELGHPKMNSWTGPRGVVTGAFSFDLELMRSILVEIPDWKTWEALDPIKDSWGLSFIFEVWLYNYLQKRVIPGEQYYFNRAEEATAIVGWNDYIIEGVIHFLLSETFDRRLVLFALNVAPLIREFEWDIYGKQEKRVLQANDFHYEIIDKIHGGEIFVKVGNFERKWVIDKEEAYGRALYLFYDQSLPRCLEWDNRLTGDFLR